MQVLVETIRSRFEQDVSLRANGRKLYFGLDGAQKSVLPYVDLIFVSSAPTDNFAADVEEYQIQFSIFTKRETPDLCFSIIDDMVRVFDDCELDGAERSPPFYTLIFERTGIIGPRVVEGVYQAIMTYRVVIQRLNMVPATREAGAKL